MRNRCVLTIVASFCGGCVVSPDAALRDRCITVMKEAFEVGAEEDFWAKMHAAEGLTAAGQSAWVQSTLSDMLGQSWNAQQICGLCREMIRAGRDEFESAMIVVQEHPEYGGATHAAESLFKVGKLGRRDLMEKAAENPDSILSMMACAALVRAGDTRKLGRVRLGLSEQTERARVVACWILGQLGDESDIKRIRKAGEKGGGDTKFNAHVALARLKDAEAREGLYDLLKDPEEKHVAAVCEALATMRLPNARSHLIPLLADDRLDVRVRAAHALLAVLPELAEQSESPAPDPQTPE